MTESATGIVLRTRPFSETSLIVNWLTSGLGRLDTIAKGARRAKSPFRGKLDLFYESEFSFARSRRSELHILREVGLRETHVLLRRELGPLQQAAYVASLIELATEKETPLPAIFELMRGFLHALAPGPPLPEMVFAFELKLLDELGLHPDLEKSRLSPGAKQLVGRLTLGDWSVVARVRSSGPQSHELRQFLHGYLIFHLGRIPQVRVSALGLPA
jgi:DNA repair protein RecO (recombination protein O)